MALRIISVLLFTVFFSEGLTLMCYNCSTTSSPETCKQSKNCTQGTQCRSLTTSLNNVSFSDMNCAASCVSWSVNVGQFSSTSQCCSTDLCNNVTESSNEKMCYTCNDLNCNTTKMTPCKGAEDKCITGIAQLSGKNYTFKGCASNNTCDNYASYLQFQGIQLFDVSCQNTSMRNSAQGLTQGAVLLLVPILPVLLSI